MAIDPEQTNFLLRYLSEIILGLVALLLMLLKLVGQRAQVDAANVALSDAAITRVELLEFQMATNTLIREEFDKFRTDVSMKLTHIHGRIDEVAASHSK